MIVLVYFDEIMCDQDSKDYAIGVVRENCRQKSGKLSLTSRARARARSRGENSQLEKLAIIVVLNHHSL